MNDLVMTVDEVAAALRISRGSAYEAIRAGELPAVRIGRTLRVPRHALERMLGAENLTTHDSEARLEEVIPKPDLAP